MERTGVKPRYIVASGSRQFTEERSRRFVLPIATLSYTGATEHPFQTPVLGHLHSFRYPGGL